MILILPQPPKFWDFSCAPPPQIASTFFLNKVNWNQIEIVRKRCLAINHKKWKIKYYYLLLWQIQQFHLKSPASCLAMYCVSVAIQESAQLTGPQPHTTIAAHPACHPQFILHGFQPSTSSLLVSTKGLWAPLDASSLIHPFSLWMNSSRCSGVIAL